LRIFGNSVGGVVMKALSVHRLRLEGARPDKPQAETT
jgi:hypothetical protein